MKATEELKAEHRGIERMLAIGEKAAQRLAAGAAVDGRIVEQMVDFLRTFADKCHHGKEEQQLFPAMEKAGVPRQGGPIGVMLAEHEQGRAFIRSIAERSEQYARGDRAAAAALASAIGGYVNLLRGHIYKEDNVLFPMADAVLKPHDDTRLAAAFADIESNLMGPGVHERYHAMLDELEALAAAW